MESVRVHVSSKSAAHVSSQGGEQQGRCDKRLAGDRKQASALDLQSLTNDEQADGARRRLERVRAAAKGGERTGGPEAGGRQAWRGSERAKETSTETHQLPKDSTAQHSISQHSSLKGGDLQLHRPPVVLRQRLCRCEREEGCTGEHVGGRR